MRILWGIAGILIILFIAFLLSENRKKINYRTILGAFFLQAFFAMLVLYIPMGQAALGGLAAGVAKAINAGYVGVEFVFGPLAQGKVGFVFAVSVLAIIVFFASLISVLYYLRIMPLIINTLGLGIHKLLQTSKAESISATGNIFVGQTEAPLIVKPFLSTMTRSELFAVMVGGLASVAGSVLVGYAALGIDIKYLIAASFMAAPGGLLMAKILIPQTEVPIQSLKEIDVIENKDNNKPANIIEAAANGAASGLILALNVGAMLIAFVGLIALADGILGGLGSLVGLENLSFRLIFGYLFSPVALVIGIPWSEAVQAGTFLGEKILFNEFVAYLSFAKEVNNFTPASQAIITFALCGFANIGSIGIMVGGIGSLAPNQKSNIAKLALKALIAGTLANLMSATLAGIFLSL
ncbi:NupC/NupG family nucleoside CNT transporter [Candidatus Hepatincolaceae symbiont of Richtersius coronifer]